MQISRIDPTDAAAFARWFAVSDASVRHGWPDGPHWREHELAVLMQSTPHARIELVLAEDDGDPVGAGQLKLALQDNLALAEVDLQVLPDERRRGVGTALLEHLTGLAARDGRHRVAGYVEGPLGEANDAGVGFALRHGFTPRLREITRVQRAPYPVDAIREAVVAAEPLATRYRIRTFTEPLPDDVVAEYARLEGRLSVDAPMGELDYEAEAWDVERIRQSEARGVAMGRIAFYAVAVTEQGGLAGITEIAVAVDDDRDGFQGTTLVDPPHRGHRLGLLLKAANLQALLACRPGIERIWTWNAEVNDAMIAINEILGFEVVGWNEAYQRDG